MDVYVTNILTIYAYSFFHVVRYIAHLIKFENVIYLFTFFSYTISHTPSFPHPSFVPPTMKPTWKKITPPHSSKSHSENAQISKEIKKRDTRTDIEEKKINKYKTWRRQEHNALIAALYKTHPLLKRRCVHPKVEKRQRDFTLYILFFVLGNTFLVKDSVNIF